MLSSKKFAVMIDLQDRLNSVINPEWKSANYPWHCAIMVEGVEALEHYGWKWWKKQTPDLAQARIELMDIFHFALSRAIELYGKEGAVEILQRNLTTDLTFAGVPAAKKIEYLISEAATHHAVNYYAFRGLMNDFELSPEQLYTMYVGKNVLNMFRQANGYKEGTYIKTWFGHEDNIVLDKVLAINPDMTPDELLAELAQVYARVSAA